MKKKSSARELLQKLGTLMALFILVLIFCIMMPDTFPKITNIMNIFKQASINCLIASGMLCALITAGIDLSVGSNCVLCTCTIGVLVENFGITSTPLLIIAGLAVSTFAGFINGTLLTRLDLPHPFVSTMGMKNVLWGIALVITGSKSIGFTNKGVDSLMAIGGNSVFTTYNADGTVNFPGSVLHLPRVPDPVRPGPSDLLRGRQPGGGPPVRHPLQERADLRVYPVRLHGRHGWRHLCGPSGLCQRQRRPDLR